MLPFLPFFALSAFHLLRVPSLASPILSKNVEDETRASTVIVPLYMKSELKRSQVMSVSFLFCGGG